MKLQKKNRKTQKNFNYPAEKCSLFNRQIRRFLCLIFYDRVMEWKEALDYACKQEKARVIYCPSADRAEVFVYKNAMSDLWKERRKKNENQGDFMAAST